MQGFNVKAEGKRLLGRPRHRWYKNIKLDLKELGLGTMDCIHEL
jgi:hypothetical protein